MKTLMMSRPGARWKAQLCIVMIACGLHASAATIAVNYSLAGAATGIPAATATTLTFDSLSIVSVISGSPNLNAAWNPVTAMDHNVVDFTTGLNNATVVWTFSDGGKLFGTLLENVSQLDQMGVGPFTQTFTFTGGTREFAGATAVLSGTGVGTTTGFTSSGSGTINAPAIPEPASVALFLGGLAVLLGLVRRSKAKNHLNSIAA